MDRLKAASIRLSDGHDASRGVSTSRPTTAGQPSTPNTSRIAVLLDARPKTLSLSTPPTSWVTEEEEVEDELIKSDITHQRKQIPQSTADAASSQASAISQKRSMETVQTTTVVGAVPTTEPQKRKRGRPKGSGLGSKKHGQAKPSSSVLERTDRHAGAAPDYALKKRRPGRPPKAPSPTPRQVFERLQPQYLPFLCEWKGCHAELHNVETLRRHIFVVHGRSDPLVCQWAKCAMKSPLPTFEFNEDWKEHVEKEHLVPFVWHMGDGYSNTSPGGESEDKEELPAYLFDESGNQVTPSVKDQEVEDLLTWRSNRRRLRELFIQRDANAPSEEEDDDDAEDGGELAAA